MSRIRLSDHFTVSKLIRFVLPSVAMMIFTSVYGIVDGIFISNFCGKAAFAGVNLIMPFGMLVSSLGFMIGAGGSALVAKTLGEGKRDTANRYFSMMVYLTVTIGVVTSVLGIVFMEKVALLLGATTDMLDSCVLYGRTLFAFNTAFMLQCLFQSFLVAAEKPRLGLFVTVAAGLTNMLLDPLFVGAFGMGVFGAALASGLSQCVGGLVPLIYFLRPNNSLLRLVLTRPEPKPLIKACANGSSELMSNVSGALVGMAYNFQLVKHSGDDGVAAYGVLMYVLFIFAAIFIGYSIGSAPVVGYHYGAKNKDELKNLLRKSLVIMGACGIALTLSAELSAPVLSGIFVGYDKTLLDMTTTAMRIYSLHFVIAGVNIFLSSFFTALNNGAVSAAISFIRTIVLQLLFVMLLPEIFGIGGIWWAVNAAEIGALGVSLAFLAAKRKKYGY